MHFFEQPILNSPYAYPGRHWELVDGQPTDRIIDTRRRSEYVTPVPQPKKRGKADQQSMILPDQDGLSDQRGDYNPTPIINEIRQHVERWRQLPNPRDWGVTPETARLLHHWRCHEFSQQRPFFCQVEAVETAIWLAEVAPRQGARTANILQHIQAANQEANPELLRLALKLATGAGKTTVMAMLIAWQTINAVRHPTSKKYSRGFLVVTPGITIRDRLRVLQPHDPDSYYRSRELVPADMLPDLAKAIIVITNYHAFKLRETVSIAKGTRALLEGWREETVQSLESEGAMIQRVAPGLMGLKKIIVLNDEAHHCYRERQQPDGGKLTAEEKDEAKRNNEAARLWISGIETIKRKLGVQQVYDLSATPFFLRGSGYNEGTLFPWTVSDFSLMDAIECGIVKLPRVPVADNVPGGDTPKFRNLWDHIGKDMPKKGRAAGANHDPLKLPVELQAALDALYGHYAKVFAAWRQAGITVPPVFIIVCNNTATSKLVHDYIAGFHRPLSNGSSEFIQGRLDLFCNYDDDGNRLARPRTLLIDSEQLESGEALDKDFRAMEADAIERFRRDILTRTGNAQQADAITDQDLLREVMNSVGRPGQLGEQIRCVVSVSMLTEGWDANTVTHILGVRAFGTQLLCEQVIGRALRRQSYELGEDNLFAVEYADILGIPFDFTAKPVVVKPAEPRPTIRVHAVSPERDGLEIRFPRIRGYRVDLRPGDITARFTADSALDLTPELVGPTVTHNQGLIGAAVDLTLDHLHSVRPASILLCLTHHMLTETYRDAGEAPPLHLFGQMKAIVRQWLDGGYLRCHGGVLPGQVLYRELADMACQRIKAAIMRADDQAQIKAVIDPYNPVGSTRHVNFTTSKEDRWQTDPRRCHINWAMLDSGWEGEFCRVVEHHPQVRAYVKNHNLGFEVPYSLGASEKLYRPDFIVLVDTGAGEPLHLVIEIKGYRGEDAKDKASTMRDLWVPGVNALGQYGRWAFAEFTDAHAIDSGFDALIRTMIQETQP